MSQIDIDDDLILEYLAESREHLTTIQSDLLAMEQAGETIDEDLVNRVFRAAHSIKGGAGFFDLVKIKELAHKTENVLDLIRSRQLIPNSKIINTLLLAFDLLRDLIFEYKESNKADISEFTRALTNAAAQSIQTDDDVPIPDSLSLPVSGLNKVIEVAGFDLIQARRTGKTIYRIELDLIHDVQQRGITPLAALRTLVNGGEILETTFDFDSAGTLEDDPSNRLILEILYASKSEAYAVSQLLEINPEQIIVVEQNGPVEAAGAKPSSPANNEILPAVLSNELIQSDQDERKPQSDKPLSPSVKPGLSGENKSGGTPAPADSTIRLNVALLDALMNLAGELVLSRNQLNDAVSNWDESAIRASSHRLSLVTSEVQEAISLTRMQPVMTLFQKFPRLVRDLAGQLGKEVQLKLDGGDVELDKTILEGLSDPLTHMVRNSVDHGIEPAEVRLGAGKPASGTVTLRARHQAGQVMIEIDDDGKGLSGAKIAASAISKGMLTAEQAESMTDYDKLLLIFMPGFSTAEKLTSVSGRGVGMDVVKTNLDRLGGKIEIQSVVGSGTSFRIKLPLTLAIIPSLLVSDRGERFAIPQVSINELVRVPANQIPQRMDRAGDAEVMRVRDRLVPMVHLADALGTERARKPGAAINMVLVDSGVFEYGLVVEDLHETFEIVVKPMGRHLRGLREYAGATILGDGTVATILDVAGLAARAGLTRNGATGPVNNRTETAGAAENLQSLLLFENAPGESCALPIELVTRVERIRKQQVELVGGRRTMQYQGASLPLVTLHDLAASVAELSPGQQWVVVIFERGPRPIGLLVAEPLDMIEIAVVTDTVTYRQAGVLGSAILNGRTTLMLDIFALAGVVSNPAGVSAEYSEIPLIAEAKPVMQALALEPAKSTRTVLVADDSDFFRHQISSLIAAIGVNVISAEDGQSAWEMLNEHASEVDLITTDVEMPRLDGIGLTKRIRADGRFTHLPIIALSSLAGEDEVALGLSVGVNEYQVKLDPEQLVESVRKVLERLS